jgi:hypothetical protein
MKLSYNADRDRYEVSHLGKLIDHDQCPEALMDRNGWGAADELPITDFAGDDQLTDEEIAAFFEGEVA